MKAYERIQDMLNNTVDVQLFFFHSFDDDSLVSFIRTYLEYY